MQNMSQETSYHKGASSGRLDTVGMFGRAFVGKKGVAIMCDICRQSPDCRDHEIEVYINRFTTSKIPRGAPQKQWAKFHSSWQHETMTARELAINVWRGFSFAPVCDGRKTSSNFKAAHHLALDFDCGDGRAKIETLLTNDLINYFSSFLYYTPSNSPPNYKSRVVFVFDEPITDLEYYEDALKTFAALFPDSDQSTTDGARFFYGSKEAELVGNWSILPRASLDYLVDQWRADNPPPPPVVNNYSPVLSDEKKIAAALRHIPTKLDYGDWVRVLMAVHTAYPDNTGINLCEAWSPGYEGEVEDKFKSFDRNKNGGVSIGTLFKMAKDNGWKPTGAGGSKNDLRAYI